MTLRQAIRRAMGEATYARLQTFRRRRGEPAFCRETQTTIQLRVGDYVLSAPSNHILALAAATTALSGPGDRARSQGASRASTPGRRWWMSGPISGYGHGDHGDVFTESEDPGGAERLLPGFSA